MELDIWAYGGITLISFLIFVAALLYRVYTRRAFEKFFNVELPDSVGVHRTERHPGNGTLILHYPYWAFAKKDGTRDRRRKSCRIIKPFSTITVSGWEAQGRNPYAIYGLAQQLRQGGAKIDYCSEEQTKDADLSKRAAARLSAQNLDNLILQFSEHPTNFESFCADLYRGLGYEVSITPPTRDGGYDLSLVDKATGQRTLVECKCYKRSSSVGRPVIQKLVGANATEHADALAVVTTGHFSEGARAYATQVRVTLIDGNSLLELCRKAWGTETDQVAIAKRDAWLTREDILARIPEDMRYLY